MLDYASILYSLYDRIYVVVQIVFILDDKCELYPNDAITMVCIYAKTLSQFVVASIHFV